MSPDWYPGIRAFCAHWQHAPMLQETFASLEREFGDDSDACIDAAKGVVECACRVLIEELDDPSAPLASPGNDVAAGTLLGIVTRLLQVQGVRHAEFLSLIKEHNRLTDALRRLRNEAGIISHGKSGFLAKLSMHHRRAAILSADAIVAFLHAAYDERTPDPVGSLEPYERFGDDNALIDEFTSLEASNMEDGILPITVFIASYDEFTLYVEPSRLLFYFDREAYKQALYHARMASAYMADEEEAG